VDNIFGYGVMLLEDLIYDAHRDRDIHLLLDTLGGDGETAVRMIRSLQARCKELTVIVPNNAKSAGTILCMGAHRILMGPTSDLGPVDPQFQMPDGSLVSAKEVISAVDSAAAAVQDAPHTYPIYASLLSDVTALMVERAKSALQRSDDLIREALKSGPARTRGEVEELCDRLSSTLIQEPTEHAAVIGTDAALDLGLPIEIADPAGDQWQLVWRLWAKYFETFMRVYEGERASKLLPWPSAS
jgi:hypothetical protein